MTSFTSQFLPIAFSSSASRILLVITMFYILFTQFFLDAQFDIFQPFISLVFLLWTNRYMLLYNLSLYFLFPSLLVFYLESPDALFMWLIFLFADIAYTRFILPYSSLYSTTNSMSSVVCTPSSASTRFDRDYHRRRRAVRRRYHRLSKIANSTALPVMDTKIAAQLDSRLQKLSANGSGLHLVHDSGATRNLLCATSSPFLPFLTNRRPSPSGWVTVGGGRRLPYNEEGEIAGVTFTTVNDLRYDLYSAIAAAKRGVTTVIDFEDDINRSYLYDKHSKHATPLIERGGMLEIPMDDFLTPESTGLVSSNDSVALAFDVLPSLKGVEADFLIHRCLSHASGRQLRQLQRSGSLGVNLFGLLPKWCQSCHTAKQKREPISQNAHRHPNALPGEFLHSDLSSVSIEAIGGFKYALTVVDEGADMYYIKLLRRKSDTLLGMREIAAEIKSVTKRGVVQWTFDRGTEFLNNDVRFYIRDELQAVTFYANIEAPWENGLAERSFGVLFGHARSMLHDSGCPNHLWGRAILHAAYVRNRLPSVKFNGKSPMHQLTGTASDLTKLRVFGCPAMIHVRTRDRMPHPKLADRSKHGIFVGMSSVGNGWIFLCDRSRVFDEIQFIDSKDVKFNELFLDMRGPKNTVFHQGHFFNPDLRDATLLESSSDKISYDLHDSDSLEISSNQNVSGLDTTSVNSQNDFVEIDITRHSQQPIISRPESSATPIPPPTPSSTSSPRPSRLRHPTPRFNPDSGNNVSQHVPNHRGPLANTWDSSALLAEHRQNVMSECYSEFFEDIDSFLSTPAVCLAAHDVPVHESAPTTSTFRGDPITWKDITAMTGSDSLRYKDATLKELDGLKRKCVTLLPKSKVPSGFRVYHASVNWVTKFINGKYDKTKCRACFAGSSYDKSGSDCFAPTAKCISVLIVLCLTAMFGWFVTGLDYEMAYLNAKMDEECYMRAPTCMREFDANGEELFWRCDSAIYGHPRSAALWGNHMSKCFRDYRFHQLRSDQCVFTIWENPWTFCIVVTHSDDCIVASNSQAYGDKIRHDLLQLFPGKDLGKLSAFCGVEIVHETNGSLSLSLQHYLTSFFKLFNVRPLQSGKSPLPSRPLKSECPPQVIPWIKTRYLKLTGMLIWIFTHCRLDLGFAMHQVTRVMHNPSEKHLGILVHLCRYVCSTASWNLCFHYVSTLATAPFRTVDFVFYTYCDSSHADDPETCCSTAGYYIFLGRGQGSICGKTFASKSPSLSSTEAEYICAAEASKQSVWVSQFLDELQIFKTVRFEILEDSEPCINALRKNVSDSRFRHVRIYYHFLRDLLRDKWCAIVKIGTKDQTADLCTKLLSSSVVLKHSLSVMGLSKE